MKRLEVVPDGWMTKLVDCPAGLFVHGNRLCLKTEYDEPDKVFPHMEAYYCDTGERFWTGPEHPDDSLLVLPAGWVWKEEE